MTIEELKKMLESAEGLAEKESIIEGILELVNAEKEKGVSSYKKKDQETLKLKNAIKELGFNPDEDGDIDNFIQKQKSKKTETESVKLSNAQLAEKLANIEEQMNAERSRAANMQKKAEREKINSKLTSTIGEKIFGSKYVIESLINNGKVKVIDDDVVFVNGDDVVPFDTGIRNVLEENKDMLKLSQKSGSQSVKTDGTATSDMDFKNMSVAELKANISKVREAFIKK